MKQLSSEPVIPRGGKAAKQRLFGTALLIMSLGLHAEPWIPEHSDVVLEVLPKSLFSSKKNQQAGLIKEPEFTYFDVAKQARQYIEFAQQQSDPRYIGYAQALLKPWWQAVNPPEEILLIRAILKQHHHQYRQAIEDLELLLNKSPQDSQALFTLSTIQMVQGDYVQVKNTCRKLSYSDSSWLSILCYGQLMALTGEAEKGYSLVRILLDRSLTEANVTQQWLHTLLAEISIRLGKKDQAYDHFQMALSSTQRDPYLLKVYAEYLLENGKAKEVLALLKHETPEDALLLQLTLAAKKSGDATRLEKYSKEFSHRITAAELRGDVLHRREQAEFLLKIKHDSKDALILAKQNWQLQKEPSDTRLLLESALAENDMETVNRVRKWINRHNYQDALLEESFLHNKYSNQM